MGTGYVGNVLTRKLVNENFNVRVIDLSIFGNDGIIDLIKNKSIQFIQGDVRDEKIMKEVLKDMDCVIHLAAVVGEPLCRKIPEAAIQINEIATKKIYKKGTSKLY